MSSRPVDGLATIRLASVVMSAAVLGGASVVIGAMTPGYRPMAETVSRLGSAGQPYAPWMQAVFVIYGLLVLVGAAPLGACALRLSWLLSAAVGGYAVAAVVAGLAPKDPPDVADTVASRIHVAATIVGGGLILLAMVVVALWGSTRTDRWLAAAVAAVTMIGVIVFRFTWGSRFYGLVERSVLVPTAVWLAVIAGRRIMQDHREARA